MRKFSTAIPKAALKIYGSEISQPTRSLFFLCQENKIDYELIQVDPLKGDTRKQEFRKAFPTGQVPVIDDNGFKLGESAAILTYLCEKHQLQNWFPLQNIQQQALVNFWMHWHHSNTRSGTMKVMVKAIFPPPKGVTVEEAIAPGLKEFGKSMKFIESSFASQPRKFLCGNEPTIADLLILPEIDQHYPEASGIVDFTPYPNVQQWVSELRQSLPSYAQNYAPVVERMRTYLRK